MDFLILRQRFNKNHITLNPGKCNYNDLPHKIIGKTIRYTSR